NMGFDTIDELVEKHRISSDGVILKGMSGRGIIGGERVIHLKPMTYMNLSGEAVRAWLDYYKLDPEEDLIVIYDDVDQEPGRMRIRKKGSAGGHNGMKSIIQHIGTSSFPRIRIGVGAKPAGWDLADYVLGHFSKEDRKVVDEVIRDAADAVEMIISEGVDEAMNRYNSRGKEKEKEAAAKEKAGSGTTETTVKNE
ncbi:MAG: aminoacyl-tRNA hydrolase, partial [Eubacterium sp.]|nr:aminoacyl-tRNA hydrolase [Eubacterium sp.]